MTVSNCFTAEDNRVDPNSTDNNGVKNKTSEEHMTKPIIIWFHSGLVNHPETLRTALSSGLITHVLLLYSHRADRDWKADSRLKKMVEIVKKSDAKLIWCRDMWAYWAIEYNKPGDLFDPLYYIREIKYLRAEAKEVGADFVALDAEPYGKSPMIPYLSAGKGHIKLNNKQREQLKSAIKKTVQTVGQVDFIHPAGWLYYKEHPYEIMAKLGRFRITGSTYYAHERSIKNTQFPYEIFGAHLNPVRYRAINPKRPYFLVSDIFENSHLWSSKKGLFLYSTREGYPAVASALVDYANTLPVRNTVEANRP
jgi:hypothetical protein